MHPLKVEQPYPFRQWWVAAYSAELGRELLGRTILGEPVVLYRTEAGEAVALAGLCPHRSFPLAKSCLVGDAVQCGYHGFTFAPSGACIRIPSQETVPAAVSIRTYPVAERGGLVWLWTGEPEAADPELIPDVEAMGLAGGWAVEQHRMVTINGRYTLLIDNLLDLSHVSFIHSDTIPAGDKVAQIPVKLIEGERSLNVQRIGRGLPSNPFFRFLYPEHQGPIDQHFDAEYCGPCLIRTGGTAYAAGEARELGTQNFIHCITPATPTSVHYWVLTARNFGLDRTEIGGKNVTMGDAIQPQDVEAIEAIEAALQALPSPPREVSCRVDTGALKVRHRLESQIRGELLSPAAAVSAE